MNVHRALAATAAILGALAFCVGQPPFTQDPGAHSPNSQPAPVAMRPPPNDASLGFSRTDVANLASDIARERDHIGPLDLAEWIRDRKPRLRVIDVRESDEFDAEHVPTAESIPLEALITTSFLPDETIVVYSPEGGHAAQAWVLLRALGHEHVYFLRGGSAAWSREVLHPSVPDDATPEERAEFARAAPLSRYFGGSPREGATREIPAKSRRPRGC
jgi:rhodanese-related sulfurtransferase